jgi:hypothetical protein
MAPVLVTGPASTLAVAGLGRAAASARRAAAVAAIASASWVMLAWAQPPVKLASTMNCSSAGSAAWLPMASIAAASLSSRAIASASAALSMAALSVAA